MLNMDNTKAKALSFFPDDEEDDEEEEEQRSKKTDKTKLERESKSYSDKIRDSLHENEDKIFIPEREEEKSDEDVNHEEEQETKEDSSPEPTLSAKEKRLREIRAQIMSIKDQIEKDVETKTLSERRREATANSTYRSSSSTLPNETKPEHERVVYKKSRHEDRETVELVKRFKKKLKEASTKESNNMISSTKPETTEFDLDELALERADSDEWLQHRFEANEDVRPAKDANTKDDSWYSVDDPRNSMNRRRFHKSSQDNSQHKSDKHHKSRN